MSFTLLKSDSNIYRVYIHEQYNTKCILLIGRTREGNDYVISNFQNIMLDLFKIKITENNNVIWLHGHGPSPHFILYIYNNLIKLDANSIEMFIKNKCPIKSDKNMPLTCSLLSTIIKTDVKGLVHIPHACKLSELLG